MNKGLIIKKEWLDKIFENGKCWEMRTTLTKMRGKILLIESGSGLILGECLIIDSFKTNLKLQKENINKHQVTNISLLDKWSCAWVFQDVIKYKEPIPYKHPQGAVIWVNL
jgi:hypothetical protein